jgi:colanic acid/amylovoran biosynthesis glycosyltransferase
VGGFREKKGISYALAALGKLKQEFQNFEVTVIGDARSRNEQHEKQKIIRIIKKMQMEKHIKLLGLQPYNVTLRALYDHHIFLSPSITGSDGDTEGGAPVTIIEAAASGMPVISTRHCDIPNVLGKINANLLVQEKDVEGLTNAIKLLMQMDWGIIAENNRSYIEENHNIKILANLMEKIYHSL